MTDSEIRECFKWLLGAVLDLKQQHKAMMGQLHANQSELADVVGDFIHDQQERGERLDKLMSDQQDDDWWRTGDQPPWQD